jgi:hypothetical protein
MRNMLLAAGLVLTAASPARASFINQGTYMLDTATGLEWRNVALDAGLSYNQTEALLSTSLSGWQLATASQVNRLFTDAGLPLSPVYETAGYTAAVNAFSSAIGNILAAHPASQYVSGVAGFYATTPQDVANNIVYVAAAMLDGSGLASIGSPGNSGYITTTSSIPSYAPFLVSSGTSSPIPEPGSLALIGGALLGMAALRRRA